MGGTARLYIQGELVAGVRLLNFAIFCCRVGKKIV